MKIFLTGGTGFIGSHFINEALKQGHKISALRGKKRKKNFLKKDNLVWIDSDLDKVDKKYLKNHDVLVHLAAFSANTPYADLDECIYWNVYAPSKLFMTAYEVGITNYIVTGSCFEYGYTKSGVYGIESLLKPNSSYPTSKASSSIAFEGFAREKNISLTYLRIFQAYGDGEKETRFWPSLKKAALAGKNFEMSKGDQIRDFIPVKDIVEKLLNQIHKKNMPKKGEPKILHIASGKSLSLKNFAKKEWEKFNAKGFLKFGKKELKKGEQAKIISKRKDIV